MWKEFKAFIMRGNVLDLAVAVIIGAAFTAIVNSLVQDLVMPVIGILLAGIDLNNVKIVLEAAVLDPETAEVVTPEVAIRIGLFISAVIRFLIVAFVVFLGIRMVTKIRERTNKKEEEETAPPVKSDESVLLEEIRDLLKEDRN